MFSRRQILLGSLAVGGGLGALAWVPGAPRGLALSQAMAADAQVFEVSHSASEWHALLTPEQYDVLREEGTERPYTSALNDEHRDGTFSCAGCKLDVFSSATKFDSGTGWPSFWTPLDKAVAVREDRSFGMVRKEVHCSRCGGHLGHVFDDGPKPTGLRYCMNGVAMNFRPKAA